MKSKLGYMLFFMLFLVACSNDEPAIVKVDTPPEETAEVPELIEEVSEDEVVDEFIEFTLENEVVRVNLKQVPILNAYLQGVKNPQNVIQQMDIQKLFQQEDNDIYLLEFSCDNTCSYLLLDQSSENTGILLADLSTFEQFILSPNETRVLVKFNRESAQDYPLSTIIVIDLKEWAVLSLENDAIVSNMFDFNWPIIAANWIDEETISISVPESLPTNHEQADIPNNEMNEIVYDVIPD
ncbi:hypothetical protein [Ornithinibacillus californiensis]|uniref:hypothetical protein n=1 Tax=Ornithinibacillus californiensis TaxID=161536 RepID=UPI00069FBFFE|nr:hypothetical protein [Ornithinibacillus californiensis]